MSVLGIIGQFLIAIAGVLEWVLIIYMWIVIIAALISWVNPDPYNPIVRFLYAMTEPVFASIRRRLPLPPMPVDITPIIAIAILYLIPVIFRLILT